MLFIQDSTGEQKLLNMSIFKIRKDPGEHKQFALLYSCIHTAYFTNMHFFN